MNQISSSPLQSSSIAEQSRTLHTVGQQIPIRAANPDLREPATCATGSEALGRAVDQLIDAAFLKVSELLKGALEPASNAGRCSVPVSGQGASPTVNSLAAAPSNCERESNAATAEPVRQLVSELLQSVVHFIERIWSQPARAQ